MVTAHNPDLERAVGRGSDALKSGNLGEAQAAFRTALALDEGNPKVLALLGLAYFRGGEFEAARPVYEALVDRLPTDASHRLNLGLVYLKVGDAEKAIASLEASRALDPSQGRAVSYLGLAYARAGRYAEAYRAFLLAGQKELAAEIEINLTDAEREQIHAQLTRSGIEAPAPAPAVAAPAPAPVPVPEAAPAPPPAVAAKPAPAPPPAAERLSEPEILLEAPIEAPVMTDSVQFVLPTPEPVPEVPEKHDGRSMISRAVEAAKAKAAPAIAPARIAPGAIAPIPLSQLATESLVRPDDSDHAFEVSDNGALVVRVVDRVLTRLEGVHVTGGDLAYEPAMRRSRGRQTEEPFDYGGVRMHAVTGRGYLIAMGDSERAFTAVTLDDDIFYLREDLVFAFEPTLRWENGNVPGLRGRLPVMQFRGDGSIALRTKKPLLRVKLPAQGVVFVDASKLAGWIGRVIPRAVVPPSDGPMSGVCVECTGEGVVLVDPIGDPGPAPTPKPAAAPEEPKKPELIIVKEHAGPPPPPPAREGVVDLTAELATDDDDPHDEF